MNKTWLKTKSALVSLAIVALIAGLSGCGSKDAAAKDTPKASASPSTTASPTTTKKPAAAPVTKTTVPVAPKAPTPSAVPKLNDISFSLALDKGQDYTEATTPIFLKASQTLHMNWLVVKGGNHFYQTFSLPSGSSIAVRTNGSLAAYSPIDSIPEKLTKSGSLVFCPSDNDWEDGYYIFHSQIITGDTAVTVKLLYWIEG